MANNAINILIQAKDNASGVLKGVNSSLKDTSEVGGRSAKTMTALGAAGTALKVGVLAAGAGVAAAGGYALNAAGDFEQALNMFRSVSGASAAQMATVSARARELGNDITLPGISAKDASLAMLELSKAGLSVNDTLAASKGVLSLAKAGQLGTAEAAEIAANALNAFRLKGSEAGRVADILAAAANASSAGVHDLGFGLQMASASASAMKIPLDDTVAALGELANNGLRGSDAGTSLKTFMMSFTPTTAKASKAMKELNLDFYDARGNFVGMREVIRQLEVGTSKLTDEQKAMALETIFGSDAVRAANILLKEGTTGFDKMSKAVNRQGAATELAAAQNAGYKGALDSFKSSIETVRIELGTRFLPTLTTAIQFMARNVGPAFDKTTLAVKTLFNFLNENRLVVALVAGAISGPLVLAFGAWAMSAGAAAVATIAATWPIIAIGAAIAGAAYLIVSNWDTIKGAFATGAAWIGEKVEWLKKNWAEAIGFIIGYALTLPLKLPLLMIQAVAGIVNAVRSVNWGAVAGWFGDAWRWQIEAVKGGVSRLFEWVKGIDWGQVAKYVVTTNLNTVMGLIEGAVRGAFNGIPGNPASKFKLPRFERGVRNFEGGMAVVGERGPELVNLPRGANVYSNRESREMAGGGTTVNYNAPIYLQTAEATREFLKLQDRNSTLASMGLSVMRAS